MIYNFQRVLPSFISAFGDSFFLTGFFYLIVWAGLPLIALYIMKKSGRNLFEVSLGGITLWIIILLSHVGLAVLFFELDEFRVTLDYTDKYYLLLTTMYSGLAILLFSMGLYFSSGFSKFRPIVDERNFIWVKAPPIVTVFVVLFGILCLGVTLLFASKLSSVPLYLLLGIGEGDIASSRAAGGNSFEGRAYLYNMFIQDLPPFLTAVAYGVHKEKPIFLNKIIFVVLFGISVFGAVLLTSKGGLINFFLIIMITHYVMQGDKIKLGPIFLVGTIGLLLLTLMMKFVFMPSGDFSRAFLGVISRALAGGHESYQYIQIFPNHIDFLSGRTFPNPGGVLPFQNYSLTIEVQNYLHPDYLKFGQGSAPTTFWGDLYANFGVWGIVVITPMIGFVVGCFDAVVSRIANSPLKAALIGWLAIHLSLISITSFHYLLLDTNLYLIILCFVFLHFIGRMPLSFKFSHKI